MLDYINTFPSIEQDSQFFWYKFYVGTLIGRFFMGENHALAEAGMLTSSPA